MADYTYEKKDTQKDQVPITTPLPQCTTITNDWHLMREYLTKRDLCMKTAQYNNWYPSMDCGDWAIRIVIPAISCIPTHRYWQARAIDSQVEKRYTGPKGARLDALIWCDSEEWVPQHQGKLVVAEGPMDALAAASMGAVGCGLMGIRPNQEALYHLSRRIQRHHINRVIMLADQDNIAGMMVLRKEIGLMGTEAKVVQPMPHKDFASIPADERWQYLVGD